MAVSGSRALLFSLVQAWFLGSKDTVGSALGFLGGEDANEELRCLVPEWTAREGSGLRVRVADPKFRANGCRSPAPAVSSVGVDCSVPSSACIHYEIDAGGVDCAVNLNATVTPTLICFSGRRECRACRVTGVSD